LAKDDLSKNYDQVLAHLKNEGFNVFYSRNISDEEILPEVMWDDRDSSWKEFFNIAKKEEINTIIVQRENFRKNDFEKLEDVMNETTIVNQEIANEFKKAISEFKKYQDQLASVMFSWIKDGTKYSLSEKTTWFEEFEENFKQLQSQAKSTRRVRGIESEEQEDLPEDVRKKSVEELADEYYKYIEKEFPKAGRYELHITRESFWQEKGVNRFYSGKGRILMEKVSNIVERKFEAKEKEKLPQLIEDCIKWANENGLKKITKSNINGFLAEKEDDLSTNNKDILYNRVNLKLKNLSKT